MREIIKRTNTGQFSYQLEGIREFSEKVAKELLEKYPDVDYFDLERQFDASFRHQYALAMMNDSLKNGAERNIQVGDRVKIIGTASCLGIKTECIPIGSIVTVVEVDDTEGFVFVQGPDRWSFWYRIKDVERIES